MKMYIITLVAIFSLISPKTYGQEDVSKEFLEWVEDGDFAEIKKQLEKGADINYKDEDGENAAFYAIENYSDNNGEVIKYLLEKNIDVTIVATDKTNVLHIAAENEAKDIIKELVKKGANINQKDKNEDTPILLAAQAKDYAIVKLLSDLGANLTLKNDEGKTILDYYDLEEEGIWEHIMSLKLTKDLYSYLLYTQVDEIYSTDMMKQLIAKGADVNYVYDEEAIIFTATYADNKEIVAVLINNGVNLNTLNEDNENILFEVEHPETITLAAKKGINLNHKNNNDMTALHRWVKRGYIDMVKALVEAGANINELTSLGTPLAYAKTLKDMPGKTTFATEELRQKSLDSYLKRLEEVKKYLISKKAK